MYAAGWELCIVRPRVVRSRLFGPWDWQLIAERLGPTSQRTALGGSSVIKGRITITKWGLNRMAGRGPLQSSELAGALESLTGRLLEDGWEQEVQVYPGSAWHLRSFRRRIARGEA